MPLRKTDRMFFLIVFSILCVAGCNPLQPVVVDPPSIYTLNASPTSKLYGKTTQKTILVTQTTANPGYQTSSMIYVDNGYQLKAYTRNEWVAPPSVMMTSLITQSLRNAKKFHAVVESPFPGLTNYRLDTRLLKFQQVFSKDTSFVEIGLQAHLIDNATLKIIASRYFSARVQVKNGSPYAVVVAANEATQHVLQQVVKFVLQKI